MIKNLLFDMDDTLLDFGKCERHAFKITCDEYGLNSVLLYDDYNRINSNLWEMFDRDEITKEELVISRYIQLFDLHKIKSNPEIFNKDYLANLGKSAFFFDGVESICKDLYESGRYVMYIITNGVASTQTARFYGSVMCKYFKDIFVSESIGYQKPMKQYFDYVIATANINRDETLIIGDSLSSDIRGGNNSGIQTCWYNPDNKINDTNCMCKYIINNLNELRGILLT